LDIFNLDWTILQSIPSRLQYQLSDAYLNF